MMQLVRRNFGLKVTAAVIAVVLWITFNLLGGSQTAFTKTIEVPLAVRGVPAKYVASTNVRKVSIELAGPRGQLESLTAESLSAFVDCAGKSEGTYAIAVNTAGGAADRIKRVSPDQAIVVLDRYAYKTVPVALQAGGTGPLPPAAAVEPRTVTIAGAQTQVAQVVAAQVVVNPRLASKAYETEVRAVPIDAQLAPVGGVVITPATVRVLIRAYEKSQK